MASSFWLVLAPVAAAVVVLIRRSPAARRASLKRFTKRVGLPMPQRLRARVESDLAARNMATDLGAIGGVAAVAAWATITGSGVVDGAFWGLVLIGAAFSGAAVGAALVGTLRLAGRAEGEGPRLARPAAADLDDYVAPLELHGGRVAASLPAVALIAATAVGALSEGLALDQAVSSGPIAATLLSILGLAGSEWAGRRINQRPQPARSDLELAWSDALRARVLRDLATVPICVGTFATFGVLANVHSAIRDEAVRSAATGAGAVLVVALIGIAVASTIMRPHRHFRRQLWPGFEAGHGNAS